MVPRSAAGGRTQHHRSIWGLKISDHGVFRQQNGDLREFSWWNYREGAFPKNQGLRIDHILLSEELASRCNSCIIDRAPRKWEQPSDHAPVIATLE